MTIRPVAPFSVAAAVVVAILAAAAPIAAQERGGPALVAGCPADPAGFYPCAKEKARTFEPPRTPDGHPDLTGYWATRRQAMIVEAHPESMGIRPEPSIVVDPTDGKIPYQPWAVEERERRYARNQNPTSVQDLDPPGRCMVKGVPRQMYNNPFVIQFLQTADHVVILHEQNHAYQVIPLGERPHVGAAIKMWMGDARGRWEGNTLVVETTNQNGKSWLDLNANFYSDAARVVERHTLVAPDVILYEATIEDPKVFTRPWTIAFPLRRNTEKGLEIMEFACHEGNRSPAIQLGNYGNEGR